ncbi:rRNA maturation RNase YbeY [Desulfurispira natronophila]|uniref:Endoribonuclease YbeY n=1 Tax=Desulfurispira natronophila TaxID=682562 RepID=A0A7W7Y459_9BACT|nr:rRNA maturation RNase YbeY [Desulfurispira natronophila]MBB5021709.1 putative rRNA maturation factor [Desulfurispira natronophila]
MATLAINNETDNPRACQVLEETWQVVAPYTLGDINGILNVLLCDRETMTVLNGQYRQKVYATDVLSFQYYTPEELATLASSHEDIGDIALCIPVIEGNAVSHGVSFEEELSFMLIHGILHILGYDHEISEEQAQHMRELELDLLDRLSQSRRCKHNG